MKIEYEWGYNYVQTEKNDLSFCRENLKNRYKNFLNYQTTIVIKCKFFYSEKRFESCQDAVNKNKTTYI